MWLVAIICGHHSSKNNKKRIVKMEHLHDDLGFQKHWHNHLIILWIKCLFSLYMEENQGPEKLNGFHTDRAGVRDMIQSHISWFQNSIYISMQHCHLCTHHIFIGSLLLAAYLCATQRQIRHRPRIWVGILRQRQCNCHNKNVGIKIALSDFLPNK